MKNITIIVAGGSGTRFGANLPKQFLLLNGKPVLQHTLEAFATASDEIILVLPQAHQDLWRQMCVDYHCNVPHHMVSGGDTRWQSVKNAIDTLKVLPGDVRNWRLQPLPECSFAPLLNPVARRPIACLQC